MTISFQLDFKHFKLNQRCLYLYNQWKNYYVLCLNSSCSILPIRQYNTDLKNLWFNQQCRTKLSIHTLRCVVIIFIWVVGVDVLWFNTSSETNITVNMFYSHIFFFLYVCYFLMMCRRLNFTCILCPTKFIFILLLWLKVYISNVTDEDAKFTEVWRMYCTLKLSPVDSWVVCFHSLWGCISSAKL